MLPVRNTDEIQSFLPSIEMRPFLFVFARRFLIPCGALASTSIIAGSFSNINEQKHQSILKSIGRSFSELLMGGKG